MTAQPERPGMKTDGYIVWFAHFGSIDHQTHPGPLEDIVDWVAGMQDEATYEYDAHGIPLAVEHIGHGVIEGFDDMVEARAAEQEQERQERAQQYLAEQARRRAEQPGPRYMLRLQPPPNVGKGMARCGPVIASGLTHEQCIAERDRLAAVFGEDRIGVQEQR